MEQEFEVWEEQATVLVNKIRRRWLLTSFKQKNETGFITKENKNRFVSIAGVEIRDQKAGSFSQHGKNWQAEGSFSRFWKS